MDIAERCTNNATPPAGLGYVGGSLTSTLGAPDDGDPPTLRWSGAMSDTPVVTLTYAVTITETAPRLISNTVIVDAGPAGFLTRSASIVANGYAVYLPVVLRKWGFP